MSEESATYPIDKWVKDRNRLFLEEEVHMEVKYTFKEGEVNIQRDR